MTTLRNGMRVLVEAFEAVIDDDAVDETCIVVVRMGARRLDIPRELITPIDDPSKDPVGTVRRSPTNDSWYLDSNGWWRYAFDPECKLPHSEVVGFPNIGALPGTPAAEGRNDG